MLLLDAKKKDKIVFFSHRKPTTFATAEFEDRKKFFFGLPGNPVSATVTCNLYVITALRKMAGVSAPKRTVIKVQVGKK